MATEETKNNELKYDDVFENYIRNAKPLDNSAEAEKARIDAIIQIAKLAQEKVLNEMAGIFKEGGLNVNFEFKPLPKGTSDVIKTNYEEAVKNIGVSNNLDVTYSFNVDKLKNEPPFVIYNVFLSNMRSTLVSKREAYNKNPGELQNQAQLNGKQNSKNQAEDSLENLVLDFILDKVYALLGIRDRETAKQFMTDYKGQTGMNVSESFFDFSDTRDATLAYSNMMTNKAQEAIKRGDGSLAAGYAQQGIVLAGSVSNEQFNALLNGNDKGALMNFARTYAASYLAQNGIQNANSVAITLNSVGELGTYYASENRVNINVDKIGQMNNPTEVVMTLSHELTHAIDAALGAVRGSNGQIQYRMQNNMGENISAAQNDSGDVFNFVAEMQNICYHINPNERHARVAELSALEFMAAKAGNNKGLKNTIKRSTVGFISYQNETKNFIRYIANPANVQDLNNRYSALRGKASPAARRLIDERFAYFNNLKGQNLLNTQIEDAAIEQAQQLLNQIDGLVQHRQVEPERTNTQANQME